MLKSLYVTLAVGITIVFSACAGGGSDAQGGETIVHKGITYKSVKSPYTRHIWLDRNLGASRACLDLNDSECFGDYYQWGRDADGHEKRDSNTSTTLLATFNVVNGTFIKTQIAPSDWTTETNATLRELNWKKTDGTSICPLGYRVPTKEEFENETELAADSVTNISDAFASFLKIPAAGYRNTSFAYLSGEGITARIWTSDFHSTNAVNYSISATEINDFGNGRANGYSVRCIKHYIDTTAPVFTSLADVSVNEEQFFVLDVNVTDATKITYTISDANSSLFDIDIDNGEVYFNARPDYETDPHSYTFKVTAIDAFGNSASQDVRVTLLDIVEDLEVPIFTSDSVVNVYENNTTALTLVATDASHPITYRISGIERTAFNVNSTSGVITFKVAPDYELKDTYTFLAKATDSSPNRNTGTQNVTINIIDVFEVPDVTKPVFTSLTTLSIPENQIIVLTLQADDNATISYSIDTNDSADFNVDTLTGKITFKVAPDFESGKTHYTFVAKATDTSGNEATQNISINILDIVDDEISHNGFDYLKVLSPITGKIWLDRNLGALQSCTSYRDPDCTGDYFQWGRNADGHEKTTSTTTNLQAVSVDAIGSDFILTDVNNSRDWANAVDENGSMRLLNWAKIDGSSLCPVNFRVPTADELKFETYDVGISTEYKIKTNIDAYNSFLRLSTAGYRSEITGSVGRVTTGTLWVNSSRAFVNDSKRLIFSDDNTYIGSYYRASGNSVRCIED